MSLFQITKLKSQCDVVDRQEKRSRNVRNVAQITLARACNMSLISALVKGGLMDELRRASVKEQPEYFHLLKPMIKQKEAFAKLSKSEGLLGKLVYTYMLSSFR